MSARLLFDKTQDRLQKEFGAVRKSHATRLRVALAFPNTYYLGMSSLGFQTVYRLLNSRDDVVCERVFLPDESECAALERSGEPLFSMESQTPVRDFDVVAFSLPFELDYPNALKILSLAGIEPVSSVRASITGSPLVIAGGATATFNPEPMAPFVDAFVIGDAEGILSEIVSLLREDYSDRRAMLFALAQVQGAYVPRFYEPVYHRDGTLAAMKSAPGVPPRVARRVSSRPDAPAISSILTPDTEFSDMILVEVSRGCGRRCHFCVAGQIYLPPRSYEPRNVIDGIERVCAEIPDTHQPPRVGLVSASLFDHPGALAVCKSLLDKGVQFSISSTRADRFDRKIADILRLGGHETLTIAPEAGTERLRRVINKPISDEVFLRSVETAWDAGFRRLKLYFMVGLPSETEEDVEAIGQLVADVSRRFRWRKVTVSIACFVPKPWTPFQWVPMATQKDLSRKIALIRRALKEIPSVSVTAESPRNTIAQGVLARGDRRLESALLIAAREQSNWRTAFSDGEISPAFYTHRLRSREELFPWDHLDLGVSRAALWREYVESLALQ